MILMIDVMSILKGWRGGEKRKQNEDASPATRLILLEEWPKRDGISDLRLEEDKMK